MKNHDSLMLDLIEKMSNEILTFEVDEEYQEEWYVLANKAKYQFMLAVYVEIPTFSLTEKEIMALLEIKELMSLFWECCCDAAFKDTPAEIIERVVDAAMGRYD